MADLQPSNVLVASPLFVFQVKTKKLIERWCRSDQFSLIDTKQQIFSTSNHRLNLQTFVLVWWCIWQFLPKNARTALLTTAKREVGVLPDLCGKFGILVVLAIILLVESGEDLKPVCCWQCWCYEKNPALVGYNSVYRNTCMRIAVGGNAHPLPWHWQGIHCYGLLVRYWRYIIL